MTNNTNHPAKVSRAIENMRSHGWTIDEVNVREADDDYSFDFYSITAHVDHTDGPGAWMTREDVQLLMTATKFHAAYFRGVMSKDHKARNWRQFDLWLRVRGPHT